MRESVAWFTAESATERAALVTRLREEADRLEGGGELRMDFFDTVPWDLRDAEYSRDEAVRAAEHHRVGTS